MSSTIISEHADETVLRLVAWELLGQTDVDPKKLLREMVMTDLLYVRKQIRDADVGDEFLSTQMVVLEVMYRNGLLKEDWELEQKGAHVQLKYSPLRHGTTPSALALVVSGGVC